MKQKTEIKNEINNQNKKELDVKNNINRRQIIFCMLPKFIIQYSWESRVTSSIIYIKLC